jgi:alkyl hydroperoxide reductase subunit D
MTRELMDDTEREIDALFEGKDTSIGRDLKLNLKRFLLSGALSPKDAFLTTLATAKAGGLTVMTRIARDFLVRSGTKEDEIREAEESGALLGMLNTYYRFRKTVVNSDTYGPAGLRMNVFMNSVLGKGRFEMLAFALSVMNGCESCMRSHEEFLRNEGTDNEQLHDLVRIASLMAGLKVLFDVNPGERSGR